MDVDKKLEIYKKKKILQLLYRNWYKKIASQLKEGKTLELGSGFGLAKKYISCETSEYKKNKYVDRQEDACNLSFDDQVLDNIIGVDVLHHFSSWEKFFDECLRTLSKKGRVILVEPYISPFSYLIRKLFHHERIDFKNFNISIDPDDSNMAIPTILINQNKIQEKGKFKILKLEKSDCFAYLFSFGFSRINIVPEFFASYLLKLDRIFMKNKILRNLFAFKILIVLEKNDN